MIGRFLRRSKAKAVAEIPPGVLVYAIGDIHGRLDLLEVLLKAVLSDPALPDDRKVLVFLGDYVDRGPSSEGVLELLSGMQGHKALDVRFLLGNHEETLLDFLHDPAVGPAWCDYGGRETLMSYGVAPPTVRKNDEAWAAASEAFGRALPDEHRRFLATLEPSLTIGDYFFCHAGARPGVALDQQARRDLIRIRDLFLHDVRPFEKVVVHGHTPAEAAYSDARRVGVDTGAYATGVLTAVKLQGTARNFVQAVERPGSTPRIAVIWDAMDPAPSAAAVRFAAPV